MISLRTKRIVTECTASLSESFYSEQETRLLDIVEDEGLYLHIDDYEDTFDGMLVWDSATFHIHLNEAKGNLPNSKRGRFTLAHELGHYFIDSHREGLRKGILNPHPSNLSLVQKDEMEKEADYFASCLLVPQDRLRKFTGGRKFSLEIIKEISEAFQVSLTSAVIRFAEVGTHEILAVFSSGNTVKWYTKSDDFPRLRHKFKPGKKLPATTVAGEFYTKPDSKYTDVELVDIEDWFHFVDWAPDYQMYEQCFYSDIYGFVISLIWFE